jgi:geranylgeranyl diphosphate synthase type II
MAYSMDLKRYLREKKKIIDDYLRKYISEKKRARDCPKILREAMSYALMGSGKRVRPILSLAGYEAAGGKSDNIIPVAPAVHKAFGEGTAILAGDALLTDAFHVVSRSNASPNVLINIITELTHASGPEGMVGGQTVDLLLEGKKARKKDLLYIHTHKTGALIRASVRIGALMANASPSKLNALTEYGEKVGLAFQIIDDILDITGTREELGKATGADSARGKNTYPSAFGLQQSHQMAETLISDSLNAVKIFNKKAETLMEIARYILARRN